MTLVQATADNLAGAAERSRLFAVSPSAKASGARGAVLGRPATRVTKSPTVAQLDPVLPPPVHSLPMGGHELAVHCDDDHVVAPAGGVVLSTTSWATYSQKFSMPAR